MPSVKIAIDIRRMTEFGAGTYIRNVVRTLARLDRETTYLLIGSPAKVQEIGSPPSNFPFVRGGAIIASQQDVQYTDQAAIDPLTLDVYPEGTSSRQYYEDDGISFDYQRGVSLLQTMTA